MDFANVKLLMVGAGGIGCELLKNLVLTGFTQIEVIDLDTIELSNLNRQFLFQKVHVGKPKAIIARESVLKYNPNANITAFHDSIMNTKYNVEYFKQFNIVLNALDNKAARSHVNRLCLAADVPLIESGSAGYLGQITLIKKGETECYDCLPKPAAKTFPGCTIRNTPSEPIHCIVWAKHLFNQLFGAEDPDEAVSPDGEDPENMAEAGQTAVGKTENEEAVIRTSTRQWAKETNYDSSKIFNKLFNDDIKYLLSMAKLWETRRAPVPLDWQESLKNDQETIEQDRQLISDNSDASTSSQQKISSLKLWSVSECCQTFSQSVNQLHKRLEKEQQGGSVLYWDKDDEDAMNFVASAANLRCHIFNIAMKSKFEIKSLAGNIIPAIATTNAIVAGLIVLQAMKVLKHSKINNECKTVYLRDQPTLSKLIVASQLVKPNAKCYVCASKPQINIKLNLKTFTIKNFEQKILKSELNMQKPDVEIDDGSGRIIISSEEGETESNNEKTLEFFGLCNQSMLKCDDFVQNYELRITLFQCDKFEAENVKEYEIVSGMDSLPQSSDRAMTSKEASADPALDTCEIIQMVEAESDEAKKRRYDAAFEEDESANHDMANRSKNSKKLKSSENINNNNNESADESSSDSINDASDAISDVEDTTAVSTSNNNNNNSSVELSAKAGDSTASNGSKSKKRFSTIEEIVVDDDCIIEEEETNANSNSNSNQLLKKSNNMNTNNDNSNSFESSASNNNNNNNNNNNDDDIIECSSTEEEEEVEEEGDVIEINDDGNQQQKGGKKQMLLDANHRNGNGHTHQHSPNKRLVKQINQQQNGQSESENHHHHHHHQHNAENATDNGQQNNGSVLKQQNKRSLVDDTDDSVTIIE